MHYVSKSNAFLLCSISIFFCPYSVKSQVITTIAGTGVHFYSGDGGPATAATLYWPACVAVDSIGNIYFADEHNNCIRKIDTAGIITTVAGNGTPGYTGDSILATAAELNSPFGVAIDQRGYIYISEQYNHRIRRINTLGIITTVAGNGTMGYSGDGAAATAAELSDPDGVTVDNAGNLYIADVANNCVRKVDALGIITTFAGTGVGGFSGDGGLADTAELGVVSDVALSNIGGLYIAAGYQRIREVNDFGIINTVAGSGVAGYTGDGGPATIATFMSPQIVAVDGIGNLYISDVLNNCVRKVNRTGTITTIAGNGTYGFSGDDGPATAALFRNPSGIAIDAYGNVYICDLGNERIRKISSGNHLPSFIRGHSQALTICQSDHSIYIDSLLMASDDDTGQTETWTLLSGPFHGVAVVSFTATSAGSVLTPVGLSYTPAPGYSSNDTFTVRIDDGISVAVTTIYVTVNPLPNAGAITGADSVCVSWHPVTLSGTAGGGIWRSSNALASVSAGVVSGIAPGVDTVFYIVSNTCGADTASHLVTIVFCPDEVKALYNQAVMELIVYPNPNDGTFTCSLSCPSGIVSPNDEVQISIVNMMGEQVEQITQTINQASPVQLDVPAGVYLLSANSAGRSYYTKLTVVR